MMDATEGLRERSIERVALKQAIDIAGHSGVTEPLASMAMIPDPAGAMYQRLVRTSTIAAMAGTVTTASTVSVGPRRSKSPAATPAKVATVGLVARLVSRAWSDRMMNIAIACNGRPAGRHFVVHVPDGRTASERRPEDAPV
jgi:hypothetical protein